MTDPSMATIGTAAEASYKGRNASGGAGSNGGKGGSGE